MKKNEISDIIGNIDEKYIDEAISYTGKETGIHHNNLLKWGAVAAGICVVIGAVLAIPESDPTVSENQKYNTEGNSEDHETQVSEGVAVSSETPDYPAMIKINGIVYQNSGEKIESFNDTTPDGHITSICSGVPKENDQSNFGGCDYQYGEKNTINVKINDGWYIFVPQTLYYSSLMLPEKELNEEALSVSEASMMDIVSFDESMLSDCCMIVEGIVKEVYVKHYNYDIYSDKFEENGILHGMTDTIVYEVEVEKTWYGEDISGETIHIEDNSYVTEPIFAVKAGGRYVLPIYESGETVWTLGHEYAGGDITRETPYSTLYPFHPQIEVTSDGSYIVSQDWETLTANAIEIVMDTLDDDDFWKDKMYLVDGKTFEEQMEILFSNIEQ